MENENKIVYRSILALVCAARIFVDITSSIWLGNTRHIIQADEAGRSERESGTGCSRERGTHNEVSRRLGPTQASRAEAIKQLKLDNLMPGAKKMLLCYGWMLLLMW